MGFLSDLFVKIFGENVELATVLISMIPIIELRGAIPFATNTRLWGDLALTNWKALGFSLIGSCLVVPIVALIFLPIIKWLKRTKFFGRLASAIENRVKNKAEKLADGKDGSTRFSPSYWKKILAIFVFVAIPLPLTGVWTGCCVAVFLGIDYVSSCLTVIAGNIVAGLIIAVVLEFFPWLNDYLLWIFLALIAVLLIWEVIKHFIDKRKNKL